MDPQAPSTNDDRNQLARRLQEVESQISDIYESGDSRDVVGQALLALLVEQHDISRRLAGERAAPPSPKVHVTTAEDGHAATGESNPSFVGRRVLVVDDDEDVSHSVSAALAPLGYLVEGVRDGAHAVARVRQRRPGEPYALILVSLRLPDMTGIELFLKLKEMGNVAPVVLTCAFGYAADILLVKAKSVGIRASLDKPFRAGELVNVLERVLADSPG